MARILLVEDDELLRRAVGGLLSKAGHEVVEAQNGRLALKAMRGQPAEVVVTDIVMPEMDGIELIGALRREFPAAKIIATSNGGRVSAENYLAVARNMGAQKTLPKPIVPGELLEAIRTLLLG